MKLHQQVVPSYNIGYGFHLKGLCICQWECIFSTDVAEPSDVSFERWECCLYACFGNSRGENIGWRERALFQLHLTPLRGVDVEFQPG